MARRALKLPLVLLAIIAMAFVLQLTTPAYAATAGLVAAYSLDEGSGTVINDLSGNGNTGTISGATWTTSGKYGNALSFNGSNSRVTVKDAVSLHVTNAFTVEAWVKPASVTGAWRDIIYRYPDQIFLEGSSPSGVPGAGATSSAGSPLVYGSSPIPAGVWAHVALTYDGLNLRLFVNGVQVSSVAETGNVVSTSSPLEIGGDSHYGQFFNGIIDEIRMYNTPLSASAIQSDMATPVSSTTPPTTVSVAISPNTATLVSGATQQFTASISGSTNTSVSWTASAGTVSSSGLFTAPNVTSNSTVTVKATSAADSTKSASATVTVTPAGAAGGSGSSTGLVAAYSFDEGSGTIANDLSGNGNNGTITGATWSSSSKYGSALSFNGNGSMVQIKDSPTLDLSNGMTLEAWVNPAAHSSQWQDVIYKGPDAFYLEGTSSQGVPAAGGTWSQGHQNIFDTQALPTGTWTHIAVTYDGSTLRFYRNGVNTISSPQTQKFVNGGFPLQIGGDSLFGQYFNGLIDEVRVYNLPLSQTAIQTDMNTPLSSGRAGVAVSVSVTPTTATLSSGATQQFSAAVSGTTNTAVTWSASAGTISSTGLYTAPSVAANTNVTVTATSVADSTKSSSAALVVGPTSSVSVTVSPTTASINTGATQQFTATVSGSTNTAVTWKANGGSISSTGLYTAPTTAGTYTVTATSAADTTKSASANVTVSAPQTVAVSVSPTTASINTGATQQFTATVSGSTNTAVTWKANGGSISSTGLYTAPTTAGTYTVTATSAADTTKSASANVTVSAPQTVAVSVSPTTASVNTGATQQFTATVSGSTNTSVTWTATAGTISNSGLYTAPSKAGSYTVTATSAADSTKSAQAAVTVTAVSGGGSFASVASSMAPGTFAQVTNMNGWNGGAILNVTGGGQGTAGPITDYSNKMTWDNKTNEIYFYGGQHCPGSCTNVNKLIKYAANTNTWSVVDPTGWNDSHSYQDETLNPSLGTSGRFFYRPYNGLTIHQFDIASQSWIADLPTVPTGGQEQCCGALQYFPDRNSMLYVDGDWGVWEWSFASSSWKCAASANVAQSQCGAAHPMASYPTFAQYDPVNKRVWLGGGTNVYTMDATGALTARAAAPFAIGANPQSTVTSDPVTGKLIAFNPSNAHVYASDGTTWTDTGVTSPFPNPILGGLACTPVDSYGVIACIYQSTAQMWLYKYAGTSSAPPPPPPPPATASITSPNDGSTVSGTLTVAASVTDSNTVSSVQLQVDGTNFGTPDTTSPYSFPVDTTTLANGTHLLDVQAVDSAGNTIVSTTVSVNVSNTSTTPPPSGSANADFAARCAGSGVVHCIGFDSQSDLTNKLMVSSDGNGATPVIDTTVSASGGGSLKCNVNPNTFGTDPCGSFHTRFKDDNSVVIGQGQEFYIQWRQRFQDSYYIHHNWSQADPSAGTNWKQAIIGLQDQNSCNSASPVYGNGWGTTQDGSPCATSCSDLEVVPRNSIGTEGFLYGYHSCGNWENWEPGPFSDQYSSADFLYQGTRPCLYSDPSGSNGSNCFTYQPGQWMTFQVHVKINQWNSNNNLLEIWGAYEGQPAVLIQSVQDFYLYNDCATGSEAQCGGQPKKYGNVWLTSYMTAHAAESGQPTTATWWDELVVSTKRVADPMVATPQPPSVLTTSGTGSGSVSIAWQSNSGGSESGFLIERCESDSYSCHAQVNNAPAWHQIASVGSGVTTYTDVSLTHGEVATYRVRAYNGGGNSGYAGAVCLDTSHYASHQCPGTGVAQ